jgi:hypothetical protein
MATGGLGFGQESRDIGFLVAKMPVSTLSGYPIGSKFLTNRDRQLAVRLNRTAINPTYKPQKNNV